MSPVKLMLCVAGGVILGGLCLCGVGAFVIGSASSKARTEAIKREDRSRRIDAQRTYAKQIGLAGLLWAEDHDDALPGPSDYRQSLRTYLKGDTVDHVAAFVWVFPGGKLTDVAEPSTTELGHYEDDFGKTVVYVDGHVRQFPAQASPAP